MAHIGPGELDNMEGPPSVNNNNPTRWETAPAAASGSANAAASLFECSRIKALADEREAVQKKTFTKWVNSHLGRVGCRISDLYGDLRDGYVLTRLLEVLSGEQLPRPTRGRMRIHSLENVDKALQFLKEQRVHLENVGSHDIVDGNHRLTLGLVWTIILRFQIQVIKIETEDNQETRSAKDALLLWCQMKTAGYPEVNIQNFTTSWRDGLAFNALIHRHRPDLVDFSKLTKSNATYNLQRAFHTAEQQLGLARLLDPEGEVSSLPVPAWTRLEKAEHEREVALRGELIRQEKLELLAQRFDHKAAMRESWLSENQRLVSQDNFGYDLPAVEAAMKKHEAIEADISSYEERIQAVADLAQALAGEGYYDARRVAAQRDSVLRQWELLTGLVGARRTRLEQNLALQKVFQEMVYMVDWMEEMQAQLLSKECGQHLLEVEDLLQKHGLLEGDITAQSERVEALNATALRFSQLQGYQPCDPQIIRNRVSHVHGCLAELRELAGRRRAELEASRTLWALLQELEEAEAWAREKEHVLESRASGGGGGPHDLPSAARLLAQHRILQGELGGRRALLQQALQRGEELTAAGGSDVAALGLLERAAGARRRWQRLEEAAARRERRLQEARALPPFGTELDGLLAWLRDAYRLAAGGDFGRDEAFESLDQEMNSLMGRVLDVNHTVQQLVEGGHPSSDEVRSCQDHLNSRWNSIVELVEQRKEEVNLVLSVQNHLLECSEVKSQVRERRMAVESAPRAGGALQRLLSSLEAALLALEPRLQALREEGEALTVRYPAQAPRLQPELEALDSEWAALGHAARNCGEALATASRLQKFLHDLDSFLDWLVHAQESASGGGRLPGCLEEADSLLTQHAALKEEMDRREEDFGRIQAAGDALAADGAELGPELALEDWLPHLELGWQKLLSLWEGRREALAQAHIYQLFLRDVRQAHTVLHNQETVLSGLELPGTVETVVEAIKRHRDFLTTLELNLQKIQVAVQAGDILRRQENIYAEKAQEHVAQLLLDRWLKSPGPGLAASGKLWAPYQGFPIPHPACVQLDGWIHEKMLMARDSTREEGHKLRKRWLRHQAFMAELAQNKEWLEKIEKVSGGRASSYSWESCNGSLLIPLLHGIILSSICPQTMESQVEEWCREVGELQAQTAALPLEPASKELVGERQTAVGTRIVRLIEPLKERRRLLLASKELHQVAHDLEDEIVRCSIAGAESRAGLGFSRGLPLSCQSLRREIQGHRGRVEEVLERAGALASLRSPEAEVVSQGLERLQGLWSSLQEEAEGRQQRLDAAFQVEQYYFDMSEVEAWLGEQEVLLMSEETGKDEQSTLQLLKKHLLLEQSVENYEESIAQLSRQCRSLLELGHPDSEQISRRQSQVDRLYVALKELGEERRARLEQQYWLYQLSRQVDELEHWIAEKEVVAGSPELGQDFEHVTVLQEKFTEFASETGNAGRERLAAVNQMVDELIECGHTAAATMAEWKDGLNEAWAELLELMGTRAQLLAASRELHKFFSDARELQSQIEEKRRRLPRLTAPPEPRSNAGSMQRALRAFEHDLQLLVSQVRQLQEGAAQLRTVYAGEHAEAIAGREQEVLQGWRELLAACEDARLHVSSTADALRFHSQARDLLTWMEGIVGQIGATDKPRDVSSVEVLMNYHQGLKTEIEARGPELASCLELGRSLLLSKSPMADEIQAQLDKLVTRKEAMTDKWDQHWEWLQQMLEVHQFAQEAVVADAWLNAQEPLLQSRELGSSVDEVEQLIRRHEAFRKAAAAWEERFSSLRRLTTVSLLLQSSSPPPQQCPRAGWPDSLPLPSPDRETEEPTRLPLLPQPSIPQSRELPPSFPERMPRPDRPRARDRPKPRRRPRPRDPSGEGGGAGRRSRSAPAQGTSAPPPPPPSHTVQREGFLLRKRELEGPNRKASNRSWMNLYCVLNKGDLGFYKDAKGPSSGGTHGGEPLFSLHNAICEVASDYKKKKNPLHLRHQTVLPPSQEEMKGWLQAMESSVAEHAEISRWSQTLPTTSSTDEANPRPEGPGPRRASGRRK
uniref:Spectrin beta chain n=1 Tax=Monodelphis domestica TaxID=13616 RepID=A0A5F8GKG9_MONDO